VKDSYLDNEEAMMVSDHKKFFPRLAMSSTSVKKTRK